MLDALGVFAGGFNLDAAEAVIAGGAVEPGSTSLDAARRAASTNRLVVATEADDDHALPAARDDPPVAHYEKLNGTGSDRGDPANGTSPSSWPLPAGQMTELLGADEAEWDRRTEDELDNLEPRSRSGRSKPTMPPRPCAWSPRFGQSGPPIRVGEAARRRSQRHCRRTGSAAGVPGGAEYVPRTSPMERRQRRRFVRPGPRTLALATTDTPANWEARARAEMALGNIILAGDGSGDAAEHFERAVHYADQSPVPSTLIMHDKCSHALPNRGTALRRTQAEQAASTLESGSPSMIALSDFAVGYVLHPRQPRRDRTASVAPPPPTSDPTNRTWMDRAAQLRHGTRDDALAAIIRGSAPHGTTSATGRWCRR